MERDVFGRGHAHAVISNCLFCSRVAINFLGTVYWARQSVKMASTGQHMPPSSGNQFVGFIPRYDGDTDDWSVYQEVLEEYFKANGVPDDSRVPVLISVIGTDTYRLLRDLCHPDSPKDLSYAELCAMLAKQFLPEIAIFRERAQFYRAEQQVGEDVKTWYARLKSYSVNCKFGDHLEPLLLDKFIVGLAPGPVQDRLCEENEHLTMKAALDLAARRESAIQDRTMVDELADMSLEHHHGREGWKHSGRRCHRGHCREGSTKLGSASSRPREHDSHTWRYNSMGQMKRCGTQKFCNMEQMVDSSWPKRCNDMKCWAKFCHKMQSLREKGNTSSCSSSDTETDNEKQKGKDKRCKGHQKKGDRCAQYGCQKENVSKKCSWGKRRAGRKEQSEAEETVTKNHGLDLVE